MVGSPIQVGKIFIRIAGIEILDNFIEAATGLKITGRRVPISSDTLVEKHEGSFDKSISHLRGSRRIFG